MKLVLWFAGCWAMPAILSVFFLLMTVGVTADWGAVALGPVVVGAVVVEALFFAGSTGVFLRHLKDLGVTHQARRVAALAVVQAATFAGLVFATLAALNR